MFSAMLPPKRTRIYIVLMVAGSFFLVDFLADLLAKVV